MRRPTGELSPAGAFVLGVVLVSGIGSLACERSPTRSEGEGEKAAAGPSLLPSSSAPRSSSPRPTPNPPLAATPLPPLDNPEVFLEAHLRRWALKDPKNVWALVHALPIFGPEVKLEDGQTLLQAILANATWKTVGRGQPAGQPAGQKVNKKRTPAFAGRAPDGTPLEPHANLVASALLLAKVPAATPFEIDGQATTVGALYEGARLAFEPPADGRLGAQAWTLTALAAASETPRAFENHLGQTIDPLKLARAAAADLERETAFLQQVRVSGAPLQKRRQGIFAEPCGGYHYLEAAARFLPASRGDPALATSLTRTLELTTFRLRAEAELYDQTHAKAPARYQRLLWIQELKFFGHTLEALGVLRDGGLAIRPEDIAFARRRLLLAIESLRALGAFRGMEAVNAARHQSYLDLIGDSSHALQGLRAWPEH